VRASHTSTGLGSSNHVLDPTLARRKEHGGKGLPICSTSYINSHECDEYTAKLAAGKCSKLIVVCINMCLHSQLSVSAQSNILLSGVQALRDRMVVGHG